MKKLLSLSNIILICCILLSTLLAFIVGFKNSFWVWVSTILGVLSSKMASSGKWNMFVFDIISYITYIYICVDSKYFGEMTLSFIIIIINIFCLIEWRKKQLDNIVEINTLNKSEIKFTIYISIILVLIYSAVLQKLNCQHILLNALSTISYLLGSYYCYRRSICQFYSWTFYEIIFIILWTLSAISGNLGNIVLLVGGISELIYDIIGINNWKKIQATQNSKTCILSKNITICKKMKW